MKKEKTSLIEKIFRRKELYFLRGEVSALYTTVNKLCESKIVLNQYERVMILDALCCKEYEDKVAEPKTRRFIREIYKDLKEKIKITIKEPEQDVQEG